ncbi:MAG: multiheme c-type cytochrome, partial [Planctomycetota bacterium]
IKFLMMLDALKYLNYAAVATGLEELKLGADFLLQQMPGDPEDRKKGVALLGANVVLFDQPDLGWPMASRIVQVGDVKVGVTAVIGASLRDQVAPVGAATNISIQDPAAVLPAVIDSMQAEKPAFLVLLCHGNEAEAKQLAEKFPQFQIILAAGGLEEPDAKPVVVGKTWILNAGHKGKRVGVLGYYPDNAAEPFKFDLVELDDTRFQNDKHMRDLMRNYQQQIQDEGLATSDELLLRHPSGLSFTGAAKCAECHKKAFEIWKDTKHAEGLSSLKTGHPGQEKDWIVRIHDPECLSCHVTGWEPQQMLRFESGYFNEEKTPHLIGQQCENCHGPGSKHVALEESLKAKAADLVMADVTAARNSVKRTLEQARREMCIQCHDSDNSPKFKPDAFMEYWEQIAHPGKD